MKVVFLLDNREYVEVAPDKLQVRQIKPDVAALGTEVTVPVNKEDGTPDLDEKGVPKTQTGFRPFINYTVNLTIPYATVEDEIAALKKQLGDKLEEQERLKLPRPLHRDGLDFADDKSNGVAKIAKKPAKASAKRKGNL